MPASVDSPGHSDRVAGCVLGAAIGDALGYPVEFLTDRESIREAFPPDGLTGFELWWGEGQQRFAPHSDDTQMAEVVLRALLASRSAGEGLVPTMERIGRGFAEWADSPQGGHRAPGGACLRGSRELATGRAWDAGDPDAGGCGSVMRAYPFALLFLDDEAQAETWAVAHSRLTHGHPMALAACAGLVVGVGRAARGRSLEETLGGIVAACARHDRETAELCEEARRRALAGDPPDPVLERLLGWNAREAIAAATYVLARHAEHPRAALLEAANSVGDSDSIATLVGALVGARCGLAALPADWVRDVERSEELQALASELAAAASGGVPAPASR